MDWDFFRQCSFRFAIGKNEEKDRLWINCESLVVVKNSENLIEYWECSGNLCHEPILQIQRLQRQYQANSSNVSCRLRWNNRGRCTRKYQKWPKRTARSSDLSLKVARYSFSGSIPPKFEHKLRRHRQSFRKIATTVVLDKDENLLWSGSPWHRSCHSNEMFWQKFCVYKGELLIIQGIVSKFHIFVNNNN